LELGVLPRLANNTAGSGLGPWYLVELAACLFELAALKIHASQRIVRLGGSGIAVKRGKQFPLTFTPVPAPTPFFALAILQRHERPRGATSPKNGNRQIGARGILRHL
jgi:hypothetical protein